jgi:hypothetical protein
MTTAIYDSALTLIPQGLNNSSQSFSALDLQAVRDLPTTTWVVACTIPPVASVTFVLEAATLAAGTYVELARLVWPAGKTGSQAVELGVAGNLSRVHSGTHRFVRVTTTQSGAWTGTSYLTKPADGSFGLASRSYALDGIGAL